MPAARRAGRDVEALRSLLLQKLEQKFGRLAEPERRRIASISSVGELARLLATVRPDKEEPAATPVPRPERPPLTFAQERLWLVYRLDRESPAYNVALSFGIAGRLSPAALAAALGAVAARHEALRTSFPDLGGEPYQRIAPPSAVPLPLADLSRLSGERQHREAARLTHDEGRRPFVLETGPVMRFCLLRLAEGDHQVIGNVHHIAFDGWSAAILHAELAAFYPAAESGVPARLPALPAQLAEIALEQRRHLADGGLAADLEFWRRRLGGELPALRLPFDRPRPGVPSHRGGRVGLTAPPGLAARLTARGGESGASLFMVLLAGLKALLLGWSSRESVLVAAEIAGRDRRESRGLIGFFVNLLLLHTDLAGDPTLAQVVERVRETALSGFEHQEAPYDRVVAELGLDRGAGGAAPAEVVFVLQNIPRPRLETGEIALSQVPAPVERAKFDLLVVAEEGEGELALSLVYSADRFDRATVERLGARYLAVLSRFATDPGAHLSDLAVPAARPSTASPDGAAAVPSRRGARQLMLEVP